MCFFHITVAFPICLIYNSESMTIQYTQEYFPEMELFQSRNVYIQIAPTTLVDYYCLTIIICYTLYYIGGIIIYIVFSLQIVKYIKITPSKELVRLQIMLFKMITFQGMIELLLVITPAYTIGISYYFKSKYVSQIAVVATIACSLQAWLNYISVMYNVTPYRNTIKKWFKFLNFNGKYNCVNVNPVSVISVLPTSHSLSR